MRRGRSILALAGITLLIAAACTSDDQSDAPAAADAAPATAAATAATAADATAAATSESAATAVPAVEPIDAMAASTLIAGNPEFNYAALMWQGYWLSRDHFGPFVMASGLGIPFEPPMEMLMGAIGMIAQNADDPVMLPEHMFPLQAVFATGSPQLVNDPREFSPLDFEAFRLDPASFDQTVRVRGQAETMLKESQWAHNFAHEHFGELDGDFGAQQRFMGIMVNMLAQMQGQYAMQELLGDDGLYHDADGALDYTANWVMLHALADIAALAGGQVNPRYANADVAPMFEGATAMLFEALAARTPGSAQEAAAATRALGYLAVISTDAGLAGRAADRAGVIATDALVGATPADVVETAATIAALLSAAVATDDGSLRSRAAELHVELVSTFDAEHGVFRGKDTYTVDDVAWLIGGLNSTVLAGDPAIRAEAVRVLTAFYEATMDQSGMQLSAPPGKDGAMAGEWEQTLPHVVYYHGEQTPPPPMSGMLPVPAREIRWDGAVWKVTDTTFDTGGAMHLANELNWFGPHLGAELFPAVGAAAAAEGVRRAS